MMLQALQARDKTLVCDVALKSQIVGMRDGDWSKKVVHGLNAQVSSLVTDDDSFSASSERG